MVTRTWYLGGRHPSCKILCTMPLAGTSAERNCPQRFQIPKYNAVQAVPKWPRNVPEQLSALFSCFPAISNTNQNSHNENRRHRHANIAWRPCCVLEIWSPDSEKPGSSDRDEQNLAFKVYIHYGPSCPVAEASAATRVYKIRLAQLRSQVSMGAGKSWSCLECEDGGLLVVGIDLLQKCPWSGCSSHWHCPMKLAWATKRQRLIDVSFCIAVSVADTSILCRCLYFHFPTSVLSFAYSSSIWPHSPFTPVLFPFSSTLLLLKFFCLIKHERPWWSLIWRSCFHSVLPCWICPITGLFQLFSCRFRDRAFNCQVSRGVSKNIGPQLAKGILIVPPASYSHFGSSKQQATAPQTCRFPTSYRNHIHDQNVMT